MSRAVRRLFTFPAAIAAIIACRAVWTCRDRIGDNDIWWHLRNGEYMALQHSWPRFDAYSFTAAGASWIDHSWLSEVLFYGFYRAWGLRGILIIFTAAVAAIGLGVFRMCLKQNMDPLAAGFATVFGGSLAMVAFMPRAQVFGWLCFTLVFAILLRFRDEHRGPLWLLPFLFCLWVNLHGSWPVGLAVFGIIAAAGWIRRDLGPVRAASWTRAEARRLAVVFACSGAALFVNPFSYRLVRYPFDLALKVRMAVGIVDEWASVNFNDSRGVYVLMALLAVFACALFSRRDWRIDDAALVAFALYCGLTHIRFLVVTGIVLPPILVKHLGRLSSYNPQQERTPLNAAVMAAVALAAVVGFPKEQYLDAQVKQSFPVEALHYLAAHPLEGRVFNQYEWGGYMEWAMPKIPVFIDTRTDIFEYRGVFKDYVAISTLNNTEQLLNAYGVTYAIYSAGTPLSSFLGQSSRWECAYSDGHAIIYRRIPPSSHATAGSACSRRPEIAAVSSIP